ncbi:protein transport protein bet1 [Malassezia yamatoensis]|uniref:Protein transport protein bet1 n=1 Tax=Malassezia yamatoensis TaxID=253288 RepID=A0AAJ6CFD4_9BASI|nr:protein transport protein bet1 [Malassezia yamatoensis]
MNRRSAAVPDRHALLKGSQFPATSSGRNASPNLSEYSTPLRTASPFENPYGDPRGGLRREAPGGESINMFQGSAAQQRSAADLEEQNDSRLDALSERIKMLKDVRGIINLDYHWDWQ